VPTATDNAIGLTTSGAEQQRLAYGSNALPEPEQTSIVRHILRASADPLSLLLLVAAIISSTVLGEAIEGTAILAIVIVNTLVRVTQERRADAAIRSLRAYEAPNARVRRDGATIELAASELVPGDVIELGAGERVPADVNLLEAIGFIVDEALLTGESVPVVKHADASEATQRNAFAGTMVLGGHALAEVERTGKNTELGKVSSMLSAPPAAPLELELRNVSLRVSLLACVVGVAMSAIAFTRVSDEFTTSDAVLSGVAIAIAAIPEGLVIAVTLALAIGAQRMAQQGLIIKRLSAIEALGAASILCSDKTGTLTIGKLSLVRSVTAVEDKSFWRAVLRCSEPAVISGDPIDIVMTQEARSRVVVHDSLAVHEPFDNKRRLAATLHHTADGPLVTMKGAPEAIFGRCIPGRSLDHLVQELPRLLDDGLRVIAVAQAHTDDINTMKLEPLGLVALADPLRDSAADAVHSAAEAGISVVMVTGDHAATAAAIGRQAGITGAVTTSDELQNLTATKRASTLRQAAVVARVDPPTKVALIEAHRNAGRIVAMTGDGVNDAPALRRADVGIAVMGSGGTDVAREAADLVVTGGDLGIILKAIEEGRRIYRNVVNVTTYLLSGNLCEIIVVALALVLFPELAVPLLPIQILWINLVTDGMPALALGMDQPRQDFLSEQPRSPQQRVLNYGRFVSIAGLGTALAIPVVLVTWLAIDWGWSEGAVRALLVTSLVMGRLSIAFIVRSRHHTFHRDFWRSHVLLVAVLVSLLAQVAIVTIEPLRTVFEFDPLPVIGWFLSAAVLASTIVVVDGTRLLIRIVTKDVRPKH
jgi:P-type E1-E2 ATPase